MKQALEALEKAHIVGGQAACDQAITALRLAIEQAEFDAAHETLEREAGIHISQQQAERQEPVMAEYKFQPYGYWKDENGKTQLGTFPQAEQQETDGWITAGKHTAPLRIYSPQRQPLTDAEIWRQYQSLWPFHPQEEPRLAADMATFARAIERAHGIGGGE